MEMSTEMTVVPPCSSERAVLEGDARCCDCVVCGAPTTTPCSRSLMWFATDDILAELSLGRSCDSPLKGGAEEMELPSCPRPRRRPRCPRGSARALLAGSRVGTKTRIVPEPLNCISAGGVCRTWRGGMRAGRARVAEPVWPCYARLRQSM